ncbi:MAG: glycosyltransferase family 4 protein [Roseiflexaceae bacterium]
MISPPPRRILYVQLAPDLYGSSRALLHVLAALDRARYTPLVALPGPGPLVDQLRKLDIDPIITPHIRVLMGQVTRSWRIVPFGLSLMPAALGMRRVIQHNAANLVHSNTWTTLSGSLGARLAGVPHVWHIREILPNFGGLKPALVGLTLRGAARLLCISDAVAAQFAGYGSAERVQVVYDGLPLPAASLSTSAREALRRSYGVAPGERLIGLVGRLHPQKGQDEFLRAVALLDPRLRANCRCLVIGGSQPGYEQFGVELEQLARQLQIADRVRFLGFQAETQPIIAALDALVLPATRPEGLGGVLLEAMAVGVPVIATRLGGPVEIIDDRISGLLIAPRQPAQLARALTELLDDAPLRHSIGDAGRLVVEQRFDATRTTMQIQQVYSALLHG